MNTWGWLATLCIVFGSELIHLERHGDGTELVGLALCFISGILFGVARERLKK